MNSFLTTVVVAACLVGSIIAGIVLRRFLPKHHLNSETKDTIKLAMGLVGTMSALLLSLLVSSAKNSYDTTSAQVTQLAAKVAFIDRALSFYGPEANPIRRQLADLIHDMVAQAWNNKSGGAEFVSRTRAGDSMYLAILELSPTTDAQKAAKAYAADNSIELGQLRMSLKAQSYPSISQPILMMMVAWLMTIFFSFTLISPANITANAALLVASLSVAAAIFLILELDRPFTGLIQISRQPILEAVESPPA